MFYKYKYLVALFLILTGGFLISSFVKAVPNPASTYCADQGYELELREDLEADGQYGICVFPDGEECEEWEFYRGECGEGYILNPEDIGDLEDGPTTETEMETVSEPATESTGQKTIWGTLALIVLVAVIMMMPTGGKKNSGASRDQGNQRY